MDNIPDVLGYDINVLSYMTLIGIIIKLFMGSSITEDGSRGPATSAIWGYGIMAASVLGIMFIMFAITTKMKMSKLSDTTTGFISALFMYSLPPMLMLGILAWVISINGKFYKRINQGKVAKEYSTYDNLSTFMILLQLGVLYKYLTGEMRIGDTKDASRVDALDALKSKMGSITYLLTLGNLIIMSIMTIILTYFSSDG